MMIHRKNFHHYQERRVVVCLYHYNNKKKKIYFYGFLHGNSLFFKLSNCISCMYYVSIMKIYFFNISKQQLDGKSTFLLDTRVCYRWRGEKSSGCMQYDMIINSKIFWKYRKRGWKIQQNNRHENKLIFQLSILVVAICCKKNCLRTWVNVKNNLHVNDTLQIW